MVCDTAGNIINVITLQLVLNVLPSGNHLFTTKERVMRKMDGPKSTCTFAEINFEFLSFRNFEYFKNVNCSRIVSENTPFLPNQTETFTNIEIISSISLRLFGIISPPLHFDVVLTTFHTELTDLLVVGIGGKLHGAGQQQGQPGHQHYSSHLIYVQCIMKE